MSCSRAIVTFLCLWMSVLLFFLSFSLFFRFSLVLSCSLFIPRVFFVFFLIILFFIFFTNMYVFFLAIFVFFFKQKAADEMRISDWSSDVCSSDLTYTARYTLSVDPDAPIAPLTTASLVPKTLFGDKYVGLQGAPPDGEHLGDGAHIPLERTSAPSEVQEVLDRLEPVLAEVDPVTFANVIASTAEGLDGAGGDIARLVDALPGALETITANQQDLGRIFRAVPGIAGTREERADQLVQVADSFGTLATTIDENEDELVRFVTSTADLSARAAELLTTEEDRLTRILDDGFSVIELVAEQPEALPNLLDGLPLFI